MFIGHYSVALALKRVEKKASLGWLFLAVQLKERLRKKQIALVMVAAVFSHWILDLVVHTPDLPLLGDNSPKLGLGLWNNAPITFILEAVLLLAGLWLYLRGTKAATAAGKYGMPAIASVLVALNALNIFGPPPSSPQFMAIFALVTLSTMAAVAFWLDSRRDRAGRGVVASHLAAAGSLAPGTYSSSKSILGDVVSCVETTHWPVSPPR